MLGIKVRAEATRRTDGRRIDRHCVFWLWEMIDEPEGGLNGAGRDPRPRAPHASPPLILTCSAPGGHPHLEVWKVKEGACGHRKVRYRGAARNRIGFVHRWRRSEPTETDQPWPLPRRPHLGDPNRAVRRPG